MYYVNAGRGTASIAFILSLVCLILPFYVISASLLDYKTVVFGEALYTILIDFQSFQAELTAPYMMVTFYVAVVLFGLTFLIGLICLVNWRRMKKIAYIPGVTGLISFLAWTVLFMELTPSPTEMFPGTYQILPGFGAIILLLSAILWIAANFMKLSNRGY